MPQRHLNVADRANRKAENPGRVKRPGPFEEKAKQSKARLRSFADVEGAQAIAERGHHAARHIASVVTAADIADAEAAEVVMMIATPTAAAPFSTPFAAPGIGGGGGGSGAGGAVVGSAECGQQSRRSGRRRLESLRTTRPSRRIESVKVRSSSS